MLRSRNNSDTKRFRKVFIIVKENTLLLSRLDSNHFKHSKGIKILATVFNNFSYSFYYERVLYAASNILEDFYILFCRLSFST